MKDIFPFEIQSIWLLCTCLCLAAKIYNEKNIEEIIFIDFKNQSLFFKRSSNYAISIIFTIIVLLFIEPYFILEESLGLSIKLLSFVLGLFILYRRCHRNHNSLEEIYSGYLSLVIILLSLNL